MSSFSTSGSNAASMLSLKKHDLTEPALHDLAIIVRGADTDRLDLAPQAVGLLAISMGLSQNFTDDHEMLRHGMVLYDALYTPGASAVKVKIMVRILPRWDCVIDQTYK